MRRIILALSALCPAAVPAATPLDEAVALERAGRLEAALMAFRQQARAGSVEAQYHLAQSLLNGGLGVVSATEAEYWYGRVRESGMCPSTIRPPQDAR